jgi:hypothetical protein
MDMDRKVANPHDSFFCSRRKFFAIYRFAVAAIDRGTSRPFFSGSPVFP